MGSNNEVSIADTLALISELMDSDVKCITSDQRCRPEKSEVTRLWCDNKKMRDLTGYQSKVALREGLAKTIEWFLLPKNLSHYKVNIYNV